MPRPTPLPRTGDPRSQRLKTASPQDDLSLVTTTTLAARTVHGTSAGVSLTDLRERRLELRAEQVRSRYLRRLLQARLDLAVAATVEAHVQERTADLDPALPVPPSAAEVSHLLSRHVDDLGTHLGELRDALDRMAAYEEALEDRCEASTEQLVAALSRVPRARLGAWQPHTTRPTGSDPRRAASAAGPGRALVADCLPTEPARCRSTTAWRTRGRRRGALGAPVRRPRRRGGGRAARLDVEGRPPARRGAVRRGRRR